MRDHDLLGVRGAGRPAWSGLSGAVVFYGDLAIGVISHHIWYQGPTALRLRAIYPQIPSNVSTEVMRAYQAFWQDSGLPSLEDSPIGWNVFLDGTRERARASSRIELDAKLNSLGGPSRWVEPPILETWNNWLHCPTWCEEMRVRLELLGVAGEVWSDTPPKTMTYETVLRKTREALRDERFDQASEDSQEPVSLAMAEALSWVMGQLKRPRYGKCFAITGRWGSGKSRILAELSQRFDASQRGHLLFPALGVGTVEESICRSASEKFDYRFAGFDELMDFVEVSLRDDLLIVIDDVNLVSRKFDEFLDGLRNAIDNATRSKRIKWLMAANSADLDAVLHSSYGEFWLRYTCSIGSDSESLSFISGWLELDQANVAGQVGFRIMEESAPEKGREERAIITRKRQEFAAEYMTLAQPVVGWLRAQQLTDESVKPGLYSDLNEANFVDISWRKRLENSANVESPRQRVESVAAAIGQVCATSDHWPVQEMELLNLLTDKTARSRLEVATALADLIRIGLLVRQASVTFGEDGMLTLGEDSFWGLRLAEALISNREGNDKSFLDIIQQIQRWLSRNNHNEVLVWSALQFVSARVADMVSDPGIYVLYNPEDYRAFAKAWIREGLPSGAMLQGALAGPSSVHASVFPALGRDCLGKHAENLTVRDRFALMRFLGAAYAEKNAATRFGRLQVHYHSVGVDGLGAYARYVVESVLRDKSMLSKGSLVATLHSLVGSEGAEIAPDAAAAIEMRGYELHENTLSELIKDIVTFLEEKESVPLTESLNRIGKSTDRRALREEYSEKGTFVEHLIDRAAARAVLEHGVDAISFLEAQGWYRVTTVVNASAVRRFLVGSVTRALGRWYREGDRRDRDSYLGLVRQMASGGRSPLNSGESRREAVYLIRHSEVTRGRDDLVVDTEFHPIIRSLAWSPDARSAGHLKAMCIANNIRYPENT